MNCACYLYRINYLLLISFIFNINKFSKNYQFTFINVILIFSNRITKVFAKKMVSYNKIFIIGKINRLIFFVLTKKKQQSLLKSMDNNQVLVKMNQKNSHRMTFLNRQHQSEVKVIVVLVIRFNMR